jgi:hypothetical protein
LHCRQEYFQIQTPDGAEDDMTDTIAALERRNDVVHAFCWVVVEGHYDKRQGWPDIQHVSHWSSGRTEKLQIQVMG